MTKGPEYGPPGYLPNRAARRARKIILREPLSVTWVVASLVAAVALIGVAVAYAVAVTGPPGPPHVEVAPLTAVDPRGSKTFTVDGADVLVVRGAGGVQAFLAPDAPATWCEDSRRIEAPDGRVWEISGRLVGGAGESLPRLPAETHDGVLYVDPTAPSDAPAPSEGDEQPLCGDG